MEINDELIGRILRQYDAFIESGVLDDVKVEGERKLFVQGYLCSIMQRENMQKTGDSLIRSQIIQTRSKYCEPVLELLASEGELYHGDLADKLNLSPSGLNAIIKKMQETEIPIIQTTQIGKYKIYSLPDNVKDFILKKEQANDLEEELEADDRCSMEKDKQIPDIFLYLQHFVELAGEHWKDDLSLLFRGMEENFSTEIREAFAAFTDALRIIYQEDQEKKNDLKRIFHNDVLVFFMEDYMKNYDLRKELDRRKADGELTSMDKQFIRNLF